MYLGCSFSHHPVILHFIQLKTSSRRFKYLLFSSVSELFWLASSSYLFGANFLLVSISLALLKCNLGSKESPDYKKLTKPLHYSFQLASFYWKNFKEIYLPRTLRYSRCRVDNCDIGRHICTYIVDWQHVSNLGISTNFRSIFLQPRLKKNWLTPLIMD